MGVTGQGTSNAMAATQQANQNQADTLTTQINNAFASPAMVAQNQSYVNALQNYYTTQLNQQQQVASRNLNFANARTGMTGGSVASDENAQLQKEYVGGIVDAAQKAQGAGAQLAASENAQKNSLISLAQAGNLTGGVSQAASTLQQGLIKQQAPGQIGNAFSDIAAMYQSEQTQAAQQKAAQNPFGTYGANVSPFYG